VLPYRRGHCIGQGSGIADYTGLFNGDEGDGIIADGG